MRQFGRGFGLGRGLEQRRHWFELFQFELIEAPKTWNIAKTCDERDESLAFPTFSREFYWQ